MATGKTIALTRQTFVSKGKSLLFNLLSRLEKGMANHFSNLALITPVPSIEISSVQSLSRVRLFVTLLRTTTHQASLSITNSRSLLKLSSVKLMMPSNHLILYHSVFSCLQSFPESRSFPMRLFFPSGGQSIGVSASASFLPMNIQD